MDQQTQFHIAYRMAAHDHRITELERGLDQIKRAALRGVFFVVLWLTAILANTSSGQLSDLLSIVAQSGGLLLGG